VLGIDVAVMSLGAGARIIEKHFTLDKNTSAFRDHVLAADPGELTRLAMLVRGARGIIGGGAKDDSIADRASARAVRRSVVAARALAEGTVLTAADLDFVRPRRVCHPPGRGTRRPQAAPLAAQARADPPRGRALTCAASPATSVPASSSARRCSAASR
jgi:sialic acid synthase SpsE